jgi:hypothetical protein
MDREVRTALLARSDRVAYTLQSTIGETTTSIELDETGASGVIYVNAEVMRIVSDDGGGDYTVERGYWDTTAEAHPLGRGVYAQQPFLENRIVKFWAYDGDQVRQMGRGYVAEPDPQDGHLVLRLRIEGPLANLGEARRLQFNPNLQEIGDYKTTKDEGETKARGRFERFDDSEFSSVVAKQRDANGTFQRNWYGPGPTDISNIIWVHVNGAIAPVNVSTYGFSLDTYEQASDITPAFPGNSFESEDEGLHEGGIYELCVINRRVPTAPYPISDAEQVVDEPFHPLFVAGILLCSSDAPQIRPQQLDFLSGNVGLDAGWLLGEQGVQSLIDTANEDSHLKIDHLALGWDGEPVNVLDEVLQMLASFGYWLAPTVDGYLEVRRDRIATVADLEDAKTATVEALYERGGTPKVKQKPGFAKAIRRYVAKIGDTNINDGTSREGRAVSASAQIDTMVEPDKNELSFKWLYADRAQFVQDVIRRKARRTQAQQPEVRMYGGDWSLINQPYDLGAWVTIGIDEGSDPVLYDSDGEDVPNTAANLEGSDFLLQLTGRGWNAEKSRYELIGRLTNFTRSTVRFIGPACRVQAVVSQDSSTIELRADLGASEFGHASDLEKFEVGQQVQLHDSKLAVKSSEVFQVTALTSQSITLQGNAGAVSPQAGDHIRTAVYDAYTYGDYGAGVRGWIYLADAALGLGSSNDEPDIWA